MQKLLRTSVKNNKMTIGDRKKILVPCAENFTCLMGKKVKYFLTIFDNNCNQ